MKDYSFIVVDEVFILSYIIQPNNIVYFKDCEGLTIHCTNFKGDALKFHNRERAVNMSEKIKKIFDIEFQIIKLN